MATMKQKYPTVRISAETHKVIKQMAAEDSVSMSDIVAEAVKQYERKRFHMHANEVWKRMVQDPEEREFWKREDELLEGTLMDGLEEDEHWE